MADEQEQQQPPKKPFWIKIAVIAAIILVADVIGGYVIFKYFIPMIYKTDTAKVEKSDTKKKGKAEAAAPLLQKALESINLNPAASSGEILSTEIVLETADQPVLDEITAREAVIRDIIITYLSYKNVGELNDITKRETFKKDLTDKINSLLKSGKITGLYTKSWIIQFE